MKAFPITRELEQQRKKLKEKAEIIREERKKRKAEKEKKIKSVLLEK